MRIIDADALLEHVKDLPTWWADGGGIYGKEMKYPDGMFDCEDIVSSIENAPTIKTDFTLKSGKWTDAHKMTSSCKCSCCGAVYETETAYCPSCGAKMGVNKK